MYLKSLEINGFKSFAKKSTLDFTTPISSIVGPNGSGKSNIAEAFRFVLGEQSIKSLRGKKGEDLIFNGTPEVARSNRASVKVMFDNRRRFLNVDFDEVTIERVVHRDSVNEYFINSTQVRLKDIIELLAHAHIGSSGHHIISQGEADKILNASLWERRTMIEDALGLKIYQYKRQESERKLEKTAENIVSVEGLRKEVAPHLRFLKKQVEKVKKIVALKEELSLLYRDYLKHEDKYIQRTKESLSVEKKPLHEELKTTEEKLALVKKVLEGSREKDTKSLEVLTIEEEIRTVRNGKDALLLDLGRVEGEIAAGERSIKKQQEIALSEEGRMVSLKDVVSVAEDIETKAKDVDASTDIQFVKKVLQSIRDIVFDFVTKHQISRNDRLVEESKTQLKILLSQKEKIEVSILEFVKKEGLFQLQYTQLKQEIDREKDTNRDAERAMFTLMTILSELRSHLDRIKAQEEKIIANEEDFKRELQEAAVLIGRSALDFATHVVALDPHESRTVQEDRRRTIEKIKIRIEEGGGGLSEEILKEYREVSERDIFLERELADLGKSALILKELIRELDVKLTTEFKNGIDKINAQFGHLFSLMFGGGGALLEVIREKKRKRVSDTDLANLGDSETTGIEGMTEGEEDGEEGVEIQVQLPRKKTKGLVMLSGGERALTSIALLFAISQVNPPPFIILDETDAALDEANSRKYGDMIENLSKYSQLILITHNRETMSRAGLLYGITMSDGGFSKLLSIEFEEAVAVAK